MGGREKGSQGSALFTAPNPPYGAIITYYLTDTIKIRKAVRQEAEKEIKKEGGDVFYPSWEDLKLEDREEAPTIILTVTDEDGNVVNRLTGPASAGFHRVVWDLRYPPFSPTTIGSDQSSWRRQQGPMVAPGTYTVSLAKRVESVISPLGETQSFEVVPLAITTLPAENREELLAFQKKTGRLQRAVMGANAVVNDVSNRFRFIKKALEDTPGADPALAERARELETRLLDINVALRGNVTVSRRSEPTPPSILQRMGQIINSWDTTAAATATHQRNYEIAAEEFEVVLEQLRQLVEVDLKQLEDEMEAAGAPWTPGRGVPKWNREN